MIQIRYTSILLWSVHDKAARAAHLPARRLSSLLPPVLEDLAPCGRPLTNPEARRSLPVPVGPPGGAPQATLRVGLHDKSATPALGLSANDAPRARETGTRSKYGSSGPAVSPHGVRPRARATRNSSGHEPGLRVGRRRSHHHALHDGSAPSKVALHHLRSAAALITTPFIMALLPPRSLCTTFVPR